jgi:cathepsin L
MRASAVLVVLAAIFVASSYAATYEPLAGVFSSWMREHGKSYSNDEFIFRWNVWRDNMKFIEEHNKSNKTFHLAMNQFGDLTNEEFNKLYKGLNYNHQARLNKAASAAPMTLSDVSALPASFDWREKGAVTPVKNQGQCGSCWSFSATGSTEGANFLKTGRLVSLSEQNLMDCSTVYGNNGCQGGLMDYAFEYIIRNRGLDTEASYPYQAALGTCRYNPANSGGSLVSYQDVPSGSEDALLNAVAIEPVSIAIDASRSTFQFYSGGVYYDSGCSSTQLDHGVLAVGWGTLNGQDYWLVKNSWGPTWGLQGFIMMARNRGNACGVATAASYPRA